MRGRHSKQRGRTAPLAAVVRRRLARATSAGQPGGSRGAVGMEPATFAVAAGGFAATAVAAVEVAVAVGVPWPSVGPDVAEPRWGPKRWRCVGAPLDPLAAW
jgi:hypothetical protein